MLNEAKAFLCWDALPNLSIQLVPIQKSVAYYFPPNRELDSILLFYDAHQHDFSESIFLLFHEAGHAQQYERLGKIFHNMISVPNGKERRSFEREAWSFAKILFEKFVTKFDLENSLLEKFDQYAAMSLDSY